MVVGGSGVPVAPRAATMMAAVTAAVVVAPQAGNGHDQQAAEPEAEENEVGVHRTTRTAALR